MTLAELTRSTAFRLAATFAALFAASVLTLFTFLYFQAGRDLEARLGTRLQNTRAEFQLVHQRDGFNELAGLVADDTAVTSSNDAIFLLRGSESDYIAGNLKSAPQFTDMRWIDGSQLQGVAGAGPNDQRYLALWFPLPGDGTLLVGYSDREIKHTRAVLLDTLLYGLAGTVLLAIGAGVFLGQRAQKQIDRVGSTLTAIKRGTLGARVPLAGSGGDIETVSRQINDTLDQLERLFHSLNHSAADIAHDLKTPIGRLKQRLETLRASPGTIADNEPLIDTTIDEVDQIVATFEALLSITQLEAGARKARFKQVDLQSIAANVVEPYEAVAEDAGMTLVLQIDVRRAPLLHGDSDLLSQLLVNLIENAIRHCPSGTQVIVAVTDRLSGPVLTVSDNGPGIPAGERENVFRRLYRLEKSRTKPGSGLGLAMVKAIADLHAAAIELADNRPGVRVEIAFRTDVSAPTARDP